MPIKRRTTRTGLFVHRTAESHDDDGIRELFAEIAAQPVPTIEDRLGAVEALARRRLAGKPSTSLRREADAALGLVAVLRGWIASGDASSTAVAFAIDLGHAVARLQLHDHGGEVQHGRKARQKRKSAAEVASCRKRGLAWERHQDYRAAVEAAIEDGATKTRAVDEVASMFGKSPNTIWRALRRAN